MSHPGQSMLGGFLNRTLFCNSIFNKLFHKIWRNPRKIVAAQIISTLTDFSWLRCLSCSSSLTLSTGSAMDLSTFCRKIILFKKIMNEYGEKKKCIIIYCEYHDELVLMFHRYILDVPHLGVLRFIDDGEKLHS